MSISSSIAIMSIKVSIQDCIQCWAKVYTMWGSGARSKAYLSHYHQDTIKPITIEYLRITIICTNVVPVFTYIVHSCTDTVQPVDNLGC